MKKLKRKFSKAAIVFLSLFTFAIWPALTPVLAAPADRGGRPDEQRDRNVSKDREGDQDRPGPRPEGRVEQDRPQRPPVRVERPGRPAVVVERGPARVVVPARPHRDYPEGRVVRVLPRGYRPFTFGGHEYYHHGGYYYRRGPSGFVIVRPPIGAVIWSLPIGFTALVLAGITYYLFEGVYYLRVPSGYMVVEPPTGVVAAQPVTPVVPATPAAGQTVTVTSPLLNVRSGPGTNFSVIGQVRQGDPLVVYGYAPDWLYVQLPGGGEYGWVMQIHTAPATPPASG